ncbi:Acyl-CoA N-acyltransferase [Cordyceps fumosorosea ARSEF 2679]|uniref:Acyl-CoA N-acyltransferase n=1 Tax=Cordyceps fumosorosea (strain ARSEF 2679) TaxID=1081104 RepID=A0A168E4A7_CORFA|nr:Acyl-CoA N-acyltransferase [Cordyceps fumosorosea ARSEF 2679]OAA73357.1 Acyl-CoA N-acyltransferase [Cordyceps fumosorosea ARSEF 2679]
MSAPSPITSTPPTVENPHRSERLVYTAFDADKHDAFLFSMHADPVSWTRACSQIQRPMTRAFHEGILRHHNSQLLFVIVNRTSKEEEEEEEEEKLEPVGKLILDASDPASTQHGNTELGIGIHRSFQGRGYGGEALRWALDWAFGYANMHRVGLTVYEWNEDARRLYEKVGFREEGRKREALYLKNRRWDEIFMSVLVHEWRAMREADCKVPQRILSALIPTHPTHL